MDMDSNKHLEELASETEPSNIIKEKCQEWNQCKLTEAM